MKIAFIVGEFPSLSQTFILNQITGAIDRGHEVDIYAEPPLSLPKMHEDVLKYDLLSRTHYFPIIPAEFPQRIKQGFQILAANFGKDPQLVGRALNIWRYGKQATSLKLLYYAVPFFGKRAQYDIIQAHFGINGLKAAYLREIGAIDGKLVTTFHGVDISGSLQKFGDRIYDYLFRRGDLFLPISRHWRQRLIELGCPTSKIRVHHMGIDSSKFAFSPPDLSHHERIRIVTIGRFVPKKGIEYGIKAVAQLLKQKSKVGVAHSNSSVAVAHPNNPPNIIYNIIGDGELRPQFQQLIEQLEVKENVRLLGWKNQAEVQEVLQTSHIMLAPSVTAPDGDREGIPVVLMEAMAMGLPVLSTQHSGIPELISNGSSGFLVPEKDVQALAGQLDYLINNPERWRAIAQAGRNVVESHYDIHKLNDDLIAIYKELLA